MKKTTVSIILFLLMAGAILYYDYITSTICDNIINRCSTLENIIYEKNWDEGYDSCVELLNYIESSYSDLAIYVTHTEVDNLKTETAKLSKYIKTNELSESLASTHYVKFTTETIKNMQKINLGNIF